MERVFTGISGSQTGGQSVLDASIPELVGSTSTLSTSSWPLNLPGAGSQTLVNLNIPSVIRRLRRVICVEQRHCPGNPASTGESRSAPMPGAA